jgi:hypothetical protein
MNSTVQITETILSSKWHIEVTIVAVLLLTITILLLLPTPRYKWIGSLSPAEVYLYLGPSDWQGTTVRWIDNTNLEVSYYPDRYQRVQRCNG